MSDWLDALGDSVAGLTTADSTAGLTTADATAGLTTADSSGGLSQSVIDTKNLDQGVGSATASLQSADPGALTNTGSLSGLGSSLVSALGGTSSSLLAALGGIGGLASLAGLGSSLASSGETVTGQQDLIDLATGLLPQSENLMSVAPTIAANAGVIGAEGAGLIGEGQNLYSGAGTLLGEGQSLYQGGQGLLSQGQQLESYETQGGLPAGLQGIVNSNQAAANAAVRSRYAAMGGNTSAEAQDIAGVGTAASNQAASLAATLFGQGSTLTTQGLSEIGQGSTYTGQGLSETQMGTSATSAGITAEEQANTQLQSLLNSGSALANTDVTALSDVINQANAQNSALSSAISNFAASLV